MSEEKRFPRICFIAPSTRLVASDKPTLHRTVDLLRKGLGAEVVFLSPHLFTHDELINHITASAVERTMEFKTIIREFNLIASVAGGTGVEDLILTIDKEDFQAIRKQKPLFIGFSDFTFLLNEIFFQCRVPGILFPSLRLTPKNSKKVLTLIAGEEVLYRGSSWLTPPPVRKISGIPIGGNLTTFVNFLNRENPPRLNWRNYILFIEDTRIDLEDLHRLLAALRRHRVFKKIRGLVIGSLSKDRTTPRGRKFQKRALLFLKVYLAEVMRRRRKLGYPLPILFVPNFGHNITRNLPAVPIGGYVSIAKSKTMTFRLSKRTDVKS